MKTNSAIKSTRRFAAMLVFASTALLAGHASAFEWKNLPVMDSCLCDPEEGTCAYVLSGDQCAAVIVQAQADCAMKQGILGKIGKRAFCKMPDAAPNATPGKRPSGSAVSFKPTPAEAAQFKKWEPPTNVNRKGPPKPDPTYPGDPAQAMKLCPGHSSCPTLPTLPKN